MKINNTDLEGVKIIEYDQKIDNRGESIKTFNKKIFEENGIFFSPVEERFYNSRKKGTLYGIHYQCAPMEQAKLVFCIQGKGFDYAIDLRKNSPNYLKWTKVMLSAENQKQIYIPKGFGHIFLSLEDNTINVLQVDEYFDNQFKANLAYNDPLINVIYPSIDIILAPHDINVPFLKEEIL